FHDADEIAAHGAADAAIVHLEHFLIGADDEVVVDADLAEFVDDHGVFLAVVFRQDTVQQRGLAGAEIAGQHGHGNLGSFSHHNLKNGAFAASPTGGGGARPRSVWCADRGLYIVPDEGNVSGYRPLFVAPTAWLKPPDAGRE